MAIHLNDVESYAMKLSINERALLAERLLSTLDQNEDISVEELWIVEAERRYKEYKAGRIKSKPAEQVFDDAINKFKSTFLNQQNKKC